MFPVEHSGYTRGPFFLERPTRGAARRARGSRAALGAILGPPPPDGREGGGGGAAALMTGGGFEFLAFAMAFLPAAMPFSIVVSLRGLPLGIA